MSAPAAWTSAHSSSIPKPASVVVPNCSLRTLRACSATKSHDGREVIARLDPARSERTQGASRLVSETSDLGGVEPGDLVEQFGPADAGQREPAGGELDPGQAELAPDLDDRGQVVRDPGVEEGVLGQGPGRDHADDVPLDHPLGEPRVLNLLADGGADASLDELLEVGFERRMGEARHLGGAGPLVLVAGRDGQAEQLRGPLGIVAEHLVEVSHPEEQEGLGIASFQLAILLHHRGRG